MAAGQSQQGTGGCSGCIGILLLLFGLGAIPEIWKACRSSARYEAEKREEEKAQVFIAAALTPGGTNYTASATGDSKGAIASESRENALAHLNREHQRDLDLLESAANHYFDKPYASADAIRGTYDDYVYSALHRGDLIILADNTKVRIVEKTQDGELITTTLYECEVLEGPFQGKHVYLQASCLSFR